MKPPKTKTRVPPSPGKAGAPRFDSETVESTKAGARIGINEPQNAQAPSAEPRVAARPQFGPVVEIEKPVYGGSFLTRVEGKAIFAPFTLSGEQVRLRITQSKSGYSTAELAEIVTPSSQRIRPACPHFGPCGGCHYQHTGYENQLAFKGAILRETLDRTGVSPPEEIAILSANPWAYRNRIRLAFDTGGNPGYRGRKSHTVLPIFSPPSGHSGAQQQFQGRASIGAPAGGGCPIAAPLLLSAAQAVADILQRVPSNLRPHEFQLFCDPSETALLATFFTSDNAEIRLDRLAETLRERIPALQSAQLAAGGRPGHPPRALARWGSNSITYQAAGFPYRVDHGAFFQVNRWLIDPLVDAVTLDRRGKVAWDLFAGVGLFARRLTAAFDRVVAVESALPAVDALDFNLRGTTGQAVRTTTLDFLRQAPRGDRPDLIIVDPPRTGLGAEVTACLTEIGAPELVYISCDPATLARDLRSLLSGGYIIGAVSLADLFPQTFHLETIVQLRRS